VTPRPALVIDGDWNVTGAESYDNVSILLRGNLTILDGGVLNLTRVDLTLAEPADQAHFIRLRANGTWIFIGGTLSSEAPGNHYWVDARAGSRLRWDTISVTGLGAAAANREGLVSSGDGLHIERSTFRDYHVAARIVGGTGIVLANNSFLDSRGNNASAIVSVAGASNVRIEGNLFKPGVDTNLLEVRSPDNVIAGNTFLLPDWATAKVPVYITYDYVTGDRANRTRFEGNILEGTGVHVNAASDVLVRDNRINNTGTARWYGIRAVVQIGTAPGTWIRNLTVEDNVITNFTRYAIRLEQNVSTSAVRRNRIADPVGSVAGEAYGIYLIRALHNVTVSDNDLTMWTADPGVLTIGISLESRVDDCRVENNTVRDANQVAVNVEGANGDTIMPDYHRGPAFRNVIAGNTLVLTRPVVQTRDLTVALVTWLWSNYTVIEDNRILDYNRVTNTSQTNGAAVRTSSSLQTIRGNWIENAHWGVVFKRFGGSQEDPIWGTFNRSANVVYGNHMSNITNSLIVNGESDGFGPIRNVVLATSNRLVDGLPEVYFEAKGPIRSIAWSSDGERFNATMLATSPISGERVAVEATTPFSGPRLRWSVAGGVDPNGTRSGGYRIRSTAEGSWDYDVPTVAPTRHAVSVAETPAVYSINETAGATGSNTTVVSSGGSVVFGVRDAGALHLNVSLLRGLPPPVLPNGTVRVEALPGPATVLIDGAAFASPHEATWNYTEPHLLDILPPPGENPETRWRWAAWSDGGDQSHAVELRTNRSWENVTGRSAPATAYNGTDYLEHLFSSSARFRVENPLGDIVMIRWEWTFDAAEDVDFAVFADPDCDGGYGATDATGGLQGATSENPERFELISPPPGCLWVHAAALGAEGPVAFDERRETLRPLAAVFTATMVREFAIRVVTEPAGIRILVDGLEATGTAEFWWREGSEHVLEAPLSTTPGGGTPLGFGGWSDGGEARHLFRAVGPATLVVKFSAGPGADAAHLLPVAVLIAVAILASLFWRRRRRRALRGGGPEDPEDASARGAARAREPPPGDTGAHDEPDSAPDDPG